MIDAKQAVQIAKQKAAEMLDEPPLNLEELERESYKGRDVWGVTFSFPRAPHAMNFFGPPHYKRFFIDAETGDFVAMKLREVASQ